MREIKGYVVRGKHKGQHAAISDVDGTSPAERKPNPFATINEAVTRVVWLGPFGWSDVAIFRVHDDGREERLPSYEEALEIIRATIAETCAPMGHADLPGFMQRLLAEGREDPDLEPDPLAALEAAERRLLEAGGWTEKGPDKWSLEGVTWDRRDAVGIARYHAAKGGA